MIWDKTERRKYPRAKFVCRIKLRGASKGFMLNTENIGAGGVRVVFPQWFAEGTTVDIEMFPRIDKIIKCKGHIVWVIRRPALNDDSGGYDAGIQFDNISDEDKNYINNLVLASNSAAPQ